VRTCASRTAFWYGIDPAQQPWSNLMTSSGLRQWPKSKKSHRIVPVPPYLLQGMSALMACRPRDAIVFNAPEVVQSWPRRHDAPVTHERERGHL
jgi:hypothetical protein